MQEDSGGATLRYTILGHVVRGGRPSSFDQIIGSRLGYAAFHAALNGENQICWVGAQRSGLSGFSCGPKYPVCSFGHMLKETERLLDGSHPITKSRVSMISKVKVCFHLGTRYYCGVCE